jgi:hypothetical protein
MIFDLQYHVRPGAGVGWRVVVLLQITCPVGHAPHVQFAVRLNPSLLDIVIHPANPLSVIVNEDVAVTRLVDEILVHPSTAPSICNNLLDFGI